MKLIAFAGKAGTGKDTAGDYLCNGYGFGKYAFAGPLKEMLATGLGLDQARYQTTEQKEAVIPHFGFTYRKAAQTLGTEWGRSMRPDLWLLIATQRMNGAEGLGVKGVAVIDMRFENEAAWVRDRGGVVVHISSTRTREGMSSEAKAHVSEVGLQLHPKDWVVTNNGSKEGMYSQLDVIMRNLT